MDDWLTPRKFVWYFFRKWMGLTVATQIDKLKVVQELDLQLLRLKNELTLIPELRKKIEGQNASQKTDVTAAKEDLKKAHARVKDIELEAKAQQDRIQKLREQQLQLKSNKEFKAMEDEIKGIQEKIAGIEDKQIAALDSVDKMAAALKGAEDAVKNAEITVKSDCDRLAQRQGELDAEAARLGAIRKDAAAQVDPAWLVTYNRIFENKKSAAVVPVEHCVCGGCNLQLAPHLCHRARQQDTMILCSYCGRLVY